MRSFFRFLDKRGLARNAAIGAIQTPKLPHSVPKALSEKDMGDLLDQEPDQERAPWIDLRDQAVLVLLYGAGLRISEALGLGKAVVDGLLKSGQDTLAITGKGNKQRLVLLLPQAIAAMKDYRDACRAGCFSDPVCPVELGQCLLCNQPFRKRSQPAPSFFDG